jgi:hypothetical protein
MRLNNSLLNGVTVFLVGFNSHSMSLMKIKTKTRSLWYGAEGTIPSAPCAAPRVQCNTLRLLSVCTTQASVLLAIVDVIFKALAEAAAAATAAHQSPERFVRFSAICAPRVWHLCSKNQWR